MTPSSFVDRTPASLLARLRECPSPADWSRFVHIYGPLLFNWARRAGLQEADAADLVQDVFAILVGKLRTFAYDPALKFRGFLKKLVHDKLSDRRRKARRSAIALDGENLGDAEDPHAPAFLDGPGEIQELVLRTFDSVAGEFAHREVDAFREHVLKGRKLKEVADHLHMTVSAVFRAKEAILRRVREELDGVLD